MSAPTVDVHARFAETLERTERLPRDALNGYRDSLLTRLVAFVHANSPFYRQRLGPLFCKADSIDLSAWSEIPLLHRDDLAAEIDRINPIRLPPEVGAVVSKRTSGSTGARIDLRTCALANVAAECMMHRLYRWHGFDMSAPLASIRFYGSGTRVYPEGATERRWSLLGPEAPHHTLDLRHRTEDLLEWIERRHPRYLLTFPSVAYDLAMHPDARRLRDIRLGAIVGISEIVSDHTRTKVRDRLGCEIAQIYACAEMGCIALQSTADDQCLVCEESVFVELLDDGGNPVGPGETGRVVLTSLYNYATPMIRYDIGDYATWSDQSCPSGRTLLRLRRINGRRRNCLLTLDGRRLWPHELPLPQLLAALSARDIQIRQNSRRALQVLCVPLRLTDRRDEADAAALLSQWLGGVVSIETRVVDSIERSSGGKREPIVSAIT